MKRAPKLSVLLLSVLLGLLLLLLLLFGLLLTVILLLGLLAVLPVFLLCHFHLLLFKNIREKSLKLRRAESDVVF